MEFILDDGETSVWKLPEPVALQALLKPPSDARPEVRLSTNECLLAGWVEQPSPCCAAASTAGALNALRSLDGDSQDATKPFDVLPIFQDYIKDERSKELVLCTRKLKMPDGRGTAALALLMTCVENFLADRGRPLTGRKEAAVTSEELRAALREVVCSGEVDDESRFAHPGVSEEMQTELWTWLRDGSVGPEAALREEASLIKLAQAHARWLKISLPSAPSTCAVGNAHLISAVHTMGEQLQLKVKVRKLCSSREKGAISTDAQDVDWFVSKDDSAQAIDLQWGKMWRAFSEPDTVLLAHISNHYALIFALRDWKHAKTGVRHRELLTSKPGQRPRLWLSWQETRKILVQWSGYCIFSISLPSSYVDRRKGEQRKQLRMSAEQRAEADQQELAVREMLRRMKGEIT